MTINIFSQLAVVTGLPPFLSICALVILLVLTLLGAFIIVRVRSIKRVLNRLNNKLDIMGQLLGWQSGESEDIKPHKFKLGSHINNEIAADARSSIEVIGPANISPQTDAAEKRKNTEIYEKIFELLKKSDSPTPYHDLTKQLSKEFPGYDYDFFLTEVEDLQKEGKVEAEIIAGKLYFQIKDT
ncbi:MAG: hypothetical protein PVG67_04235 [Desulfobacterales bacterium]|jgi:hypothetical protein